MDHFKERHEKQCSVTSDADIELENVNINEDERHFYLVGLGKLLFTITMKIDTIQKMAYWTVQHIGSKKTAHQHIYEIHVTSKKDERRKVVFIEHCFNDALKADEVIRQGKCAVIPLSMLTHFVKDNKLSFRFFIKRIPAAPKKNDNDKGNKNNHQTPKGPGKGPGPKGPGPKGQGPKGQGPGPKGQKQNKMNS